MFRQANRPGRVRRDAGEAHTAALILLYDSWKLIFGLIGTIQCFNFETTRHQYWYS